MNPLVVAARGKGVVGAARRIATIGRRYGLSPARMVRAIDHFLDLLEERGHGATFPLTAVALARSPHAVAKYSGRNVEFSVHGYFHVDHMLLAADDQIEQLTMARRLFQDRGLSADGFRSPYLRADEATLAAVKAAGFLYDSSRAVSFGVDPSLQTDGYRRVLDFERAVPASEFPSLPTQQDGLIRLPYSLPDDEALVDRLRLSPGAMRGPWLEALAQAHALDEMFTLAIHPERISACESALLATLDQARNLRPAVWAARLDEVARWWAQRARARIDVGATPESGEFLVRVSGPDDLTILARNLDVRAPTTEWYGHDRRVHATEFRARSARRPIIGLSKESDARLAQFLGQMGYPTEPVGEGREQAMMLHRPRFGPDDERPLLAELESNGNPSIRLGRWPAGHRSVLSVTGDIDALTIWDYGLRFLGR